MSFSDMCATIFKNTNTVRYANSQRWPETIIQAENLIYPRLTPQNSKSDLDLCTTDVRVQNNNTKATHFCSAAITFIQLHKIKLFFISYTVVHCTTTL